jgi:hypothetical protein
MSYGFTNLIVNFERKKKIEQEHDTKHIYLDYFNN